MHNKNLENKMKTMSLINYLICNPYSKLGNSIMGNNTEENEKCFFENFIVTSNKTYERLAQITDAVMDSAKNAIFVTGYRGCGKTTFSKLLQAIIESRINIMKFNECKDIEAKLNQYDAKFIEELSERYKQSENKIYKILSDKLDVDEYSTIDDCINFTLSKLKGINKYVNFEVGISQTVRPVEEKLKFEVKKLIKKLIENQQYNLFNILSRAYKCTEKFEYFKNENFAWDDFFYLVEMDIRKNITFPNIEKQLDLILRNFNSIQLLCIFTLLNLIYAHEHKKKVFFIFDNIDVVFDVSTLEDFTREFALFEENFSEVFPDILEAGILTNFTGFYDDITYIFVMRETSANQISDHFTDRLYEVSVHFDISKDIKKRNIIEKKYRFIDDRKDINKKLYTGVQNIRNLCHDSYFNNTIFSLFNNDYKRTISCLATIYKFNEDAIKHEIEMMNNASPFVKHGARGIVYRLIFNHFKEKQYFKKLGLNDSFSSTNAFTPFRIILTFLNNVQPEHNDQFMTDESDLVSLYGLYDTFKDIFSSSRKESQHILMDTLWSMYELRKSETWNHLITFDRVASISKDDLIYEFNQFYEEKSRQSDINVRITCAGRTYVNFVCTHFEFFACRFSKIKEPLFMDSNIIEDENGKYKFEKIISDVYNAVEKCCAKLNEFTNVVCNKIFEKNIYSLLDSKLVHRKKDRKPLLHEERIIHQHIGYIEAYRKYLIIAKKINPVVINEILISYIESYLSLLNNTLYGESSKELYYELTECVSYIKEKCNYDNILDSISREGYILISKKNK